MAIALRSDVTSSNNAVCLPHWRRVIFKHLFGFLAILCVPVYITSVYLCAITHLWGMVIFDTFAYLFLLALLLLPHFSEGVLAFVAVRSLPQKRTVLSCSSLQACTTSTHESIIIVRIE